MPFNVWAVGEEVLASDFNPYVQEQVIATFANAAARDASIVSPKAGQHAWLTSTQTLTVFDGAAWVTSGSSRLLGYSQITTTPGAFSTTALVIPGLSVTANVPTPRRVMVEAYCGLLVPTTQGYTEMRITNVGGTTVYQAA